MSEERARMTRAATLGLGALAAAGIAYLAYRKLAQGGGDAVATPGADAAAAAEDSGAVSGQRGKTVVAGEETDEGEADAPQKEPMTKEERQAAWKKASKMYKERLYEQALALFERVVRDTPARSKGELKVMYYNIAACYDKLERHHDVIKAASAAIDIDPFYKKALHRRARALIAIGGEENEHRALGDLQVDFLHRVASEPHKAPDQAPEEYQESIKTISLRRGADLFPAILDEGAELWSFPPRHGRRLMQTVWWAGPAPEEPGEEALAALRAAHEASPEGKQEAEAYVTALQSALQFEEALEVARKWYDAHEMAASPDLLLLMGLLYHVRGAVREARVFLQRAAAQGRVLAQVLLAAIADEMGDLEDAQRLLEEAEQMDARSPHVHYHRGAILLSASRYGEACDALRRSLDIAPDFAVARMQLAIGLFRLERPQEAIEALEKACENDLGMPEVHTYLGEMYALVHRVDEAVAALAKAEAIDPECPLPLITRATLGIFAPDDAPASPADMLDKAASMLATAIDRDPQNVQAYLRLAEIRGQQQDADGVEQAYANARKYSRSVHDVADVEEAKLNTIAVQRAMQHVRKFAPHLAAFAGPHAQ